MAEPQTRNRAFIAAYRKGHEAGLRGFGPGRNPYPDHRGGRYGHMITFSRAFQRYWNDGWEDGNRERDKAGRLDPEADR